MCSFRDVAWTIVTVWFRFQLWVLRLCSKRHLDLTEYQSVPLDEEVGLEPIRPRETIDRLRQQLIESGEAREHLALELRELKGQYAGAQAEKDDALRRLSELMSLKLRDNNPNIVDLSDQFRPTKLAEISSELYDNEWTTAFEYLEGTMITNHHQADRDRDLVQFLLDILMETYTTCKQHHSNEWQNLCVGIWGSNRTPSKPDMKLVKDLMKKFAIDRLEAIQQTCINQLTSIFQNTYNCFTVTSIQKYIQGCVKLCWLMQFQDPTVVLVCPNWNSRVEAIQDDTQLPRHIDHESQHPQHTLITYDTEVEREFDAGNREKVTFDKGLFKEYTTSGQYIDYCVWPVMFLYEGGPLLSKGVAQGCN